MNTSKLIDPNDKQALFERLKEEFPRQITAGSYSELCHAERAFINMSNAPICVLYTDHCGVTPSPAHRYWFSANNYIVLFWDSSLYSHAPVGAEVFADADEFLASRLSEEPLTAKLAEFTHQVMDDADARAFRITWETFYRDGYSTEEFLRERWSSSPDVLEFPTREGAQTYIDQMRASGSVPHSPNYSAVGEPVFTVTPVY